MKEWEESTTCNGSPLSPLSPFLFTCLYAAIQRLSAIFPGSLSLGAASEASWERREEELEKLHNIFSSPAFFPSANERQAGNWNLEKLTFVFFFSPPRRRFSVIWRPVVCPLPPPQTITSSFFLSAEVWHKIHRFKPSKCRRNIAELFWENLPSQLSLQYICVACPTWIVCFFSTFFSPFVLNSSHNVFVGSWIYIFWGVRKDENKPRK